MNHGNATLLDVHIGKRYLPSFQEIKVKLSDALICCGGVKPVDHFSHFTGRNKPWLQDLTTSRDKGLIMWGELLDTLNLPITSKNITDMGFKSPLGYFHPNI